ncbi:transcriptional regulator [Bacteroidia bacterium]|nr:transcriptional regulator [Bacteroidia bacterium]
MATSKTDFFDKELQQKANLFKVLSHPARLQILLYLGKSKKCITGDISAHFPLGRGTVNQHMKELKNAGLIVAHKQGAKIVYCFNLDKINELKDVLGDFLKEMQLPDDFSCCL